MDWLEDNAWAAWLATALVLAGVEAATADLVFIMLAGGALAGAAASLFLPVGGQVIAAIVVAIGLLLLVRPVARRKLLASTHEQPGGIERYFGQPATVVETVTETDGRVKLDGEVWSAKYADHALPAAPGATVTVVGVNGVTLLVSPVPGIQDVAPSERPPT